MQYRAHRAQQFAFRDRERAVVRDTADHALDEHLLRERPQVHQTRQRVPERCGPAIDVVERRPVLRQHHGDAGFVGARRQRGSAVPCAASTQNRTWMASASCSSEALPCWAPVSSSSYRLDASSNVRQHSNTSMRASPSASRRPRRAASGVPTASADAVRGTAVARPAAATRLRATLLCRVARTLVGEFRPVGVLENLALRGLHLRIPAGQHGQGSARAWSAESTNSRSPPDRGTRPFREPHLFGGNVAGLGGDDRALHWRAPSVARCAFPHPEQPGSAAAPPPRHVGLAEALRIARRCRGQRR